MSLALTRRALIRGLAGLGLMPGAALAQGSTPAAARDGTVLVRRAALSPLGPGGRLLAQVRIPETGTPVLGPKARGPAHRLLWRMVFEGRAAGNHGDLYENRDRGHSRLPPGAHPQLTHVVYDDAARAARLDYGLAGPVLFDAPLIGNSSTAVKDGPLWRSLPRIALTRPQGPRTLYQNYLAGQIHVYPEHRDHDPDHGDLIPAATPFFLISQGSSYSDRPHLEALAMILAALRPETKAYLHETQLLAATVQMIFRRSLARCAPARATFRGRRTRRSFHAIRSIWHAWSASPMRSRPRRCRRWCALRCWKRTRRAKVSTISAAGLSERLFDTPPPSPGSGAAMCP